MGPQQCFGSLKWDGNLFGVVSTLLLLWKPIYTLSRLCLFPWRYHSSLPRDSYISPVESIRRHSYSYPRSQHIHSCFIFYLLPTVLLLMLITSLPFGRYSLVMRPRLWGTAGGWEWHTWNVNHQFWSWAVSRGILSTTCSSVVVLTFFSFRIFFTDTLFFSSPSALISPPRVNTHH